ncbi:hypothetical protein PENTCL1PPCAC_1459, partial [Pristionchus entomophagus]
GAAPTAPAALPQGLYCYTAAPSSLHAPAIGVGLTIPEFDVPGSMPSNLENARTRTLLEEIRAAQRRLEQAEIRRVQEEQEAPARRAEQERNARARTKRPRHSDVRLITMSIQASQNKIRTSNGICQWIMNEFPYFRQDNRRLYRRWRLSIEGLLNSRSNLFVKIVGVPYRIVALSLSLSLAVMWLALNAFQRH